MLGRFASFSRDFMGTDLAFIVHLPMQFYYSTPKSKFEKTGGLHAVPDPAIASYASEEVRLGLPVPFCLFWTRFLEDRYDGFHFFPVEIVREGVAVAAADGQELHHSSVFLQLGNNNSGDLATNQYATIFISRPAQSWTVVYDDTLRSQLM
jgi:hypothetical protein